MLVTDLSDSLKLTGRDIEIRDNIFVRCNFSNPSIAVKQSEIPLRRRKGCIVALGVSYAIILISVLYILRWLFVSYQ